MRKQLRQPRHAGTRFLAMGQALQPWLLVCRRTGRTRRLRRAPHHTWNSTQSPPEIRGRRFPIAVNVQQVRFVGGTLYSQPSCWNRSSRLRASGLPFRAAAARRIRVWSQFLGTPLPCQYKSASAISALGLPFSTEIQSNCTASAVPTPEFARRSCTACEYSDWPGSWEPAGLPGEELAVAGGEWEGGESLTGGAGGGVDPTTGCSSIGCWLEARPA